MCARKWYVECYNSRRPSKMDASSNSGADGRGASGSSSGASSSGSGSRGRKLTVNVAEQSERGIKAIVDKKKEKAAELNTALAYMETHKVGSKQCVTIFRNRGTPFKHITFNCINYALKNTRDDGIADGNHLLSPVQEHELALWISHSGSANLSTTRATVRTQIGNILKKQRSSSKDVKLFRGERPNHLNKRQEKTLANLHILPNGKWFNRFYANNSDLIKERRQQVLDCKRSQAATEETVTEHINEFEKELVRLGIKVGNDIDLQRIINFDEANQFFFNPDSTGGPVTLHGSRRISSSAV